MTSSNLAKSKRAPLPILTSLRFVAAGLVVVFHYGSAMGVGTFGPIGDFGYEAVTFFFVLSGFILTYSHGNVAHGRVALNLTGRQFFVARAARIAPAYYLALALSFPFLFYSLFIAHTMQAGDFIAALVAVPLLVHAWIPTLALSWNMPAWSLSAEVFFYATFPFWIGRLDARRRWTYLVAAYIAVVASAVLNLNWRQAAFLALRIWRATFRYCTWPHSYSA